MNLRASSGLQSLLSLPVELKTYLGNFYGITEHFVKVNCYINPEGPDSKLNSEKVCQSERHVLDPKKS